MALKKFISYWLMPLPFCLILLVAGWWLLLSPSRRRGGRVLLGLAILLLLLFGNKVVSTALVRPLESRYPAIPELAAGQPLPPALARCREVVVLGSGNGDLPGLSSLGELTPAALGRLSEAVRLLRLLPAAGLIVSGPALPPHPAHARVLARAAVSLGIDPSRIRRIETARDTEEEAAAIRALVGRTPIALVTSAWHMPRAMTLARRAGLDALPCPVDYTARPAPEFHLDDLDWDVESLERSTAAVHERLGLLWLRIKEPPSPPAG